MVPEIFIEAHLLKWQENEFQKPIILMMNTLLILYLIMELYCIV
nr:MAG TPA: hypothetical protein [Bacteriophage sp.]